MSPAEYLTRLEQANVINSIDNLLTFPRVRSRVESGRVAIHGAYFGVATGQLSVRDPATGKFSQIAAEDYARMFAQPRF
jgi:carbonic anhydrase